MNGAPCCGERLHFELSMTCADGTRSIVNPTSRRNARGRTGIRGSNLFSCLCRRVAAALSLAMMAFGVFLGAKIALQDRICNPGNPASFAVGISGAAGRRVAAAHRRLERLGYTDGGAA
jgi:hypothetical protein